MIHVPCHECGKAYAIPESKAGKRFQCVACGARVSIPAPSGPAAKEPAPEPEVAEAEPATPRVVRHREGGPRARSRAAAPPKSPSRSPVVLGAAVFGAVLVIGLLGFLLVKRDSGKGTSADVAAAGVKGSPAPGGTVEAAPLAPKPAEDPVAAKRKALATKIAEAERAPEPAAALVALVAFCLEEPAVPDEVQGLYERALSKDSDFAEAREALGYKRYEGDDPQHKGQWLTLDIYKEVTAADEAKKAAAEARRSDPFIQKAERIVKDMQAIVERTNATGKLIGEAAPENLKETELLDIDKPRRSDAEPMKFKYFYDCKEVPRPYLIAVQDVGVPRPESWASDIGEILAALHRTFYRRYGAHAHLRDLTGTPVPVWLFGSKGSYERWRRCGNGGPSTGVVRAFYSGTQQKNESGYLYLWLRDPREEREFNEDPIEEIRETTWHEGTHQLMDFNSPKLGFSIGNSPWMQEGFAEYVGGHRRLPDKSEPDGWRYFFGIPQPDRLTSIVGKGLQEAVDPDEKIEMRPSLRETVHLTYPEFWAARAMQENKASGEEAQRAAEKVDSAYSLGWGLCHFLNHGEGGKYRERFDKWLRAELEKRSSGEYFDQLFGLDTDEKWDAFELEFQRYVIKSLRRDTKDVREKRDRVYEKYQKEFEEACAAKPTKDSADK